MNVFNQLSKFFLKNKTTNNKKYFSGTIVEGQYSNAKSDSNPLVLVLFSGNINTKIRGICHYTFGINLNKLNGFELQKILNIIVSQNKSNNIINMISFYNLLKGSITKKAYRTYFTAYLNCKPVSPGMFKAPIDLYKTNNQFINSLNSIIIEPVVSHKNKFKGENDINKDIENQLSKEEEKNV